LYNHTFVTRYFDGTSGSFIHGDEITCVPDAGANHSPVDQWHITEDTSCEEFEESTVPQHKLLMMSAANLSKKT